MNKCLNFLNYFDTLVAKVGDPIPDDIQEFYDFLKAQQDNYVDKPAFTENGLSILEYLQSCDAKSLKAKDIAENMGLTSRQVSGSIRKLCSDGYVEKFGKTPVIYSLTAKGKDFNIKNYKESLNDGQEDEE